MHSEVIKITPDIARKWLTQNKNIRKINLPWVDYLSLQIADGSWSLNGETIKLDDDGNIVDGQHRLMAVVKANRPIHSLVVFGATEKGVDEGRGRSLADLLGGTGVKNAYFTAAAVRALYLLSRKVDPWTFSGRIPNTRLLEFHESLDSTRMKAACMAAKTPRSIIAPSIVAVVSYQASAQQPQDLIDDFFASVASGVNLREKSPEIALRRWLESGRAKKRVGSYWYRSVYVAVVRAWNSRIKDRDMHGPGIWSQVNDASLPRVSGSEETA